MGFLAPKPHLPHQPTAAQLQASRKSDLTKQNILLEQGILMRRSQTTTDTISRSTQPKAGLFIP